MAAAVRATMQISGEGTAFRQGYLNTDKERTVRVRIEGDVNPACRW